MALTFRQRRSILALGALAYRYFDLVTAGDEGGAAEVRRAFVTLYDAGGRAALLAAGMPAGGLPSIAVNRGWYANYRLATISALGFSVPSTDETYRAITTMPSELSRLPAWWNGAARPVLSARLTTVFLDALMEVEYAPLTAPGLKAAIDSYLADPTPVVDSWVDTGDITAPPSPNSTIAGEPTTPTTTTVRRPSSPPSSSSDVVALPGTLVVGRKGTGATWMYAIGGVTIAFGLLYGLWRIRRAS